MKKILIILGSVIILGVLGYFGFEIYNHKNIINLSRQSSNLISNTPTIIASSNTINSGDSIKFTFTWPTSTISAKLNISCDGLGFISENKSVCGQTFDVFNSNKNITFDNIKSTTDDLNPNVKGWVGAELKIKTTDNVYTKLSNVIVNSTIQQANSSKNETVSQSAICFTPQPYYLQFGDRDASTSGEVSKLQNFLIQQGYLKTPASGYFDESTKLAVINYQKSKGLTAEGLVGNLILYL